MSLYFPILAWVLEVVRSDWWGVERSGRCAAGSSAGEVCGSKGRGRTLWSPTLSLRPGSRRRSEGGSECFRKVYRVKIELPY